MARKKVRGRFFIAVGFPGFNWTCESLKSRDLSPAQVVESLREYADFIERIDSSERPASAVATSEGITRG